MRTQENSVYQLRIGDPQRQYLVTVAPGQVVDTRRRRAVTMAQMAQALESATYILIGEQHDRGGDQ
ncbi:MAG: hypothetical protein SNJ72_04755, partial [Fimbriimonadales bacterium]